MSTELKKTFCRCLKIYQTFARCQSKLVVIRPMNDEKFIRVTLRLPKSLHETLAAVADSKTSTTNAEVVSRLEKSLLEDEELRTVAADRVSKEDLLVLRNEIDALLDRKLMSLAMALNAGSTSFIPKKD